MDFQAMDPDGDEPAIGENAHARLAFTDNNQGIVRRGYNYDDGMAAGARDVGLIFVSFQAEIERYLRIQEVLAGVDSLNQWTTPIGSALFVVPPGAKEGGWIGETILG
jgi:deferrochelatase/peroxidase EfeB